jgi:ribosomal-protein-serine acetyltransferase
VNAAASKRNLFVPQTNEVRVLRPDDAGSLFALVDGNREHLRRWLAWVDAQVSVADSLAFIAQADEQLQRNDGFHVGILDGTALAGVIGHVHVDWVNRCTEIGYWLGASFQGKGLATGACRVLVGHAFEQLELNRVEIRCASGNTRSRAIPERLGFTEEGLLRQAEWLYDHFEDHVVYGMLASEWHRATQASQ